MRVATNQSGYEPDEFPPEAIEAGVAILRREFGGETEGQNRFVDFRAAVRDVLRASLASAERAFLSE